MIYVDLKNNNGFRWFNKEGSAVKGFFFDEKNSFYDCHNMIDYFYNLNDINDFVTRLKKLNGSFAAVIKKGNSIYAAVDPLRSLPLFYAVNGNRNLFVSDDGWYLSKTIKSSEKIDEIAKNEFLLSGYTVGNSTLFDNLKQLQAGQYLYFNSDTKEIKVDFYYKHLHGNFFFLRKEEYFEELEQVYERVFSRLLKSVNTNTIVVPLSGGYDSRSIVAMLKIFGYENVICFTYGRPESFEVQTSRKVAQELGYKFYFIDYSDKRKWKSLVKDYQFLLFSSKASVLSHVQEYIALTEMKQKSLIPGNAIFVPGFSGDLLGGSYVPKEISLGKEELLFKEGITNYIFRNYFNLENEIPYEHTLIIKEAISIELEKLYSRNVSDISEFDSVAEAFFTNHKVGKFVVNALRIYEYQGYEWRMPLWDKELYEFYYHVPLKNRMKSNNLYNDFLFNKLFSPLKVDFIKRSELVSSKKKMIQSFPAGEFVWNLIRKAYYAFDKKGLTDFDAFSNLYNICEKELLNKKFRLPSQNNINSIFALWFMEIFLRNYLNLKIKN